MDRRSLQAWELRELALFGSVIARACAYHRSIGTIAAHLLALARASRAKGYSTSFFCTHCHLASMRGVQHRNTTRFVLRELAELGLVAVAEYHPDFAIVVRIKWRAVYAWAKRHGVTPWACRGSTAPHRTKADWEAERAAWRAEISAKPAETRRSAVMVPPPTPGPGAIEAARRFLGRLRATDKPITAVDRSGFDVEARKAELRRQARELLGQPPP